MRAISFTGSSEVGSLVAQRAAATFKPVSLEMGGKNAQIVLDDANLELALEGAFGGRLGRRGSVAQRRAGFFCRRDCGGVHQLSL